MKRGYADTPEGQIHYATEGEGEPILLMGSSGSSYRTFARLMPLLAKEYQAIAVDYLGHGYSDPVPPNVTMELFAQSLIHFMDALGLQKAHVFGLHTGNKINVAMGDGWPDRIGSLIVAGQPHSIIPDDDHRDEVIRAMVSPGMPEVEPTADGSHLLRNWGLFFSRLAGIWWDRSVVLKRPVTPEDLRRLEERVIDMINSHDSGPETYRANYAQEWTAAVARLKVPTLFLEPAPLHEIAEHGLQGGKLQKILPGSQWVAIEDASGADVELRPEIIAEPVLKFLRGLRGAGAAPSAAAGRR